MIHPQVAALVGDLGGQHDELSRVLPMVDAVKKAAAFWKPAHTEALNDQGVIALQQKIRLLPVHAGDQL